ncbi:hypothetical protein GHK45_22310 [Sinorhizobium meliloti]|uniref:Uncharacterized protein n=1 Tax=Rhizobium meliloti TaxID=382 RepID=A0A6A7ZW03_RHIML|nr:hypothetical protein [Sinorhizobium meliloti]MQW06359.1 hypothetical protein [Sinorhizobium meliloti]
MKPEPKRRRRNCIDRMRHALIERQRQRRGGDPAGKMALQLLAVLSALLAVLPPIPMPAFSFFPEPRRPRPSPGVSSPPGIAIRRLSGGDGFPPPAASRESEPRPTRRADLTHLDDEERGPTAYVMERGLDPPYYQTSSRAAPTWSKLVKDLKRSRSKDKASELLEYRVPPEAVEWLRSRIFLEDWLSLRSLGRDGASDNEIAAAALGEAKKWEAAQPKQPEPKPDPEPDGSGDPDTGTGLKP